jgi:pilus assembly protein CpaF
MAFPAGIDSTRVLALNVRLLLAPVAEVLEDPTTSEVMINGPSDIRVEREGSVVRVDAAFQDSDELRAALLAIAQFNGFEMDDSSLTFDGRLPDGSRVHAVLPPASRQDICIAIRKCRPVALTMDDLARGGSLTDEAAAFLRHAVLDQRNLVISGGTSSGKTTLLSAIAAAIPSDERVIVLEDVNEIRLTTDHALYFEGSGAARQGRSVTIRDLFRSSLRMRPDRIIVGECRAGEALDMIQAMSSGHSGSMTTLHASTPAGALRRLETLALMADLDLPLPAIRAQIAAAVDIIVQVARLRDVGRRVMSIGLVGGLTDRGDYRITDLFTRRGEPGKEVLTSVNTPR